MARCWPATAPIRVRRFGGRRRVAPRRIATRRVTPWRIIRGPLIIESVPVVRVEDGQQKTIGALQLRMSTARSDAAILRGSVELGIVGLAALAVVCGLLVLILKSATRPVVALTETMAELSFGALDTVIPALDRSDEVGRMARAVAVFKQNAIERQHLQDAEQQVGAHAAAEKQAALVGMAERIETESGSALAAVGAHTASIATTADEMSASASPHRRFRPAGGGGRGAGAGQCPDGGERSGATRSSIGEISRQVAQSSRSRPRGRGRRRDARHHGGAERAGGADRRCRRHDQRDRRPDQSAGAECHDRGGARRRCRQGLRGGRLRGQGAGRADRAATEEIGAPDRRDPGRHRRLGRGDRAHRAHDRRVNAIAGSIAAAVEEQGAATAEIARNVAETAAAANEMTQRISEVSAEAERTGAHSATVRDDTVVLNVKVGELRHTLVRIVRTSTTDVDRRAHERYAVELQCKVTVAGHAPYAACMADISAGGAALKGGPALAIGTRGSLTTERISQVLPFVVRAGAGDATHVRFELETAQLARLAQELGQMALRPAA